MRRAPESLCSGASQLAASIIKTTMRGPWKGNPSEIFLYASHRLSKSPMPFQGGLHVVTGQRLAGPTRGSFLCPPRRAMRSDSSRNLGGLTSGDGSFCEHPAANDLVVIILVGAGRRCGSTELRKRGLRGPGC